MKYMFASDVHGSAYETTGAKDTESLAKAAAVLFA